MAKIDNPYNFSCGCGGKTFLEGEPTNGTKCACCGKVYPMGEVLALDLSYQLFAVEEELDREFVEAGL